MSKVEPCTVSFQRNGETVTQTFHGPWAVLGRSSECDVVLSEVGISRAHARIELDDGVWKIVDLDSVNGTSINGVRVSAARLRSGDRIMLGHIGLDVAIGDGGDAGGGGDPGDVSGRATLVFETVAEERVVSVLFGYLDKFSMLAEDMPPPAITLLLNGVFEQLAEIVDELGGTVCTTIAGEGLLAFFGSSVEREDHAERATEAAWRMREAIDAMGEKLDTDPKLSMRFGVNSGAAVVGEIGPAALRQYTVVGDTVSVAGRLAHTAAMTAEILVGEATHQAVEHQFDCRALPSQKVRGRYDRIRPFKVEARR